MKSPLSHPSFPRIPRRSVLGRMVPFALGSLLLACSDANKGGSIAAAPEDAGITGDADASTRSPECTARDISLEAALNSALKTTNALLSVRDEKCGTSVYVAGKVETANKDSLWRIASITKTYVSALILTLVRDDLLALDDPMSKFVADVPGTKDVTVKMLLNHTSGIFSYTSDKAFFADRHRAWTPRELVDLATKHAPTNAPGAKWSYSNTNYILLGMIAESAGGKQIAELLHTRVLEPAGLKATFLDGAEPLTGTLAKGFSGKTDVTLLNHMSGPWTAGAMVASGGDLAEWIYALHGTTKVLKADEQAILRTGVEAGDGVSYGLGVLILDRSQTGGAGPAYGHDGGIDGFSSIALYFPEKKTSIGIVVNEDGADYSPILSAAMKKLF